ncbi:MmcQ/YjbR family DNA-binding protein [Angustibacter sp. McL0619]|uniref:MmcQ/YjbR family DNA-binding protein n=1 Tax=Angustibacter sp. McL0619 TaxID=3415676 RepID=UPI003CF5A34D
MVSVDDVRAVLADLPRSYEVIVYDRVKFRVGQIVFVAFSRDETEIGFGFPKEERAALVASRPDTFFLPRPSDLRFNWVEAWLEALDPDEMRELVLDAWRMVVPKRVAAEYLGK